MDSAVQPAPVAPAAGALPGASPTVVHIRRHGPNFLCVCADGRELVLPRLVAPHVRVRDEILADDLGAELTKESEIHIRKPSLRRADVYHAKISYAALPRPDRRSELFVKVEV